MNNFEGKEKMLIEELDLPIMVFNCLKKAGIVFVEDILLYDGRRLRNIPNLGLTGAREVVYYVLLKTQFCDWVDKVSDELYDIEEEEKKSNNN